MIRRYPIIYPIFLVLILGLCNSCVSDSDNSGSNCGVIGTWHISQIDIDSCARIDQGFVLSSLEVFCIPIVQGDICRESRWTFSEAGKLTIDELVVFTFDDNREELSDQLDGTYSTSNGILEICFADECTQLSCDTNETEQLELTFAREGCSGKLTLDPI